LKAILLNKVVVGKGCKLLQDNTNLTAPPAGYDSVGNLNDLDLDLDPDLMHNDFRSLRKKEEA